MTELQKVERRLVQLLVLGLLFRLLINPDQRRQYSSWISGGNLSILGLLLLLESSRSLCRTPGETCQLLTKMSWTLGNTLVQFAARGFQPKFPKWTLQFELVRGVMRDAATMFGDRIVDPTQAPVFRWHSELFGSFLGWFALRRHGLRLEPVVFKGLEHLWVKSLSASQAKKRLVVLFYHGEGYAVLSPRMYIPFCCDLLAAIQRELQSQTSDVSVELLAANYHKIPEFLFLAPAEDAVAMYEYLLQHEKLEPSQIILAGDSAGGGLVMSTLLRIRDGKSTWKPRLPVPLAAIVACPLADLTGDEDPRKASNCVLSPSIIAASIDTYRPLGETPRA
ncbi:hypothetical protein V7S43_009743 [Phytophthora oleae]|uniref:Alpha/beta hydrolase fold-3 domain-containing protein n=1 Tax=Phytophthora oleae TaxID=2107226 RepID=A0ABD3FHD6_9STRA